MARIQEEVARPARTETVTKEVTCDLCGRKAPNPTGFDGDVWGQSNYDVEEVHIHYKSGSRYPESGRTETLFFDVCPKCFNAYIIPAIEKWSGGVKPQLSEIDY